MATMTAQCLIGKSHTYEGGINPSHQLFLSENGRSAWLLHSIGVGEQAEDQNRIVWIPTIEHMLEDGLLLILLHVVRDEEVWNVYRKLVTLKDEHFVEFGNFPEETRLQLYRLAKQRYEQQYSDMKLVLNIFNGSSLMRQWKVLIEYPFEVEVTLPEYDRYYNAFSRQMEIREGVERK